MRKEDVIKMIWERHKLAYQPKGKSLRLVLYDKNKNCCYCGCETTLNFEQTERELKPGEEYKQNTATVEHLYHRFDIRRYDVTIPRENRHVLACYLCNYTRGNDMLFKLTKKEQSLLNVRGRQRKKGEPKALYYVDIIMKYSNL